MTSNHVAPDEAFVWIWLPDAANPIVAGRIERVADRYMFNYGRSYLATDNAIPIYDPELPFRAGEIEPIAPLTIANALRDAAPDAWGRRVIINRLTGATGQVGDPADFDELTFMLLSGSDRIGALDFQISATEYVARERQNPTLDELQQSAEMVEAGIPMTPALAAALEHGTAIGGARPKALIDDSDRKYIAKFSSSNDTYSVVKGEYVAMRLAALCGLNVAPVKLTKAMNKDVLLIERFDRIKSENGWRRKSIVSALTMFGLDEIMAAHASYPELAELIRSRFSDPKRTLHELFGRMVFNILVGNTDDHARNHAAFWDGNQLALTPAYDICPQSRTGREASQAMLICGGERRSQLLHCLTTAGAFHLSDDEALAIMKSQTKTVNENWLSLCHQAGLTEVDQKFFWRRQFLNDLAFEGMETHLAEALAGLS